MENSLKILSLEDVEDDLGLIKHALNRHGIAFSIVRVDTREEFVDALRSFVPDVILSDHSLPQFNSIEALKICQRMHLKSPFILVTGAVSEEFAVTCLKQGADDYVLKSNLARLPSAIENALKQRKYELQQKQAEQELRSRNEELVKINQEMDSFVYSVSHNIRSPLMSVLGLLDLAKREDHERDSHFTGHFNMMIHSIKKLDETVREILDYSRNARSEIELQEIDIKKLVDDCLDNLKYLAGFDQIKTIVTITKSEPFYTDVFRLSIILCNLISNSIKYRDLNKKDNRLNISILVKDERTVFTLEDNGIGIEPEILPRVFDMFFRGTLRSEGAGLGLYIVKESVTKLNGEVKIGSEAGVGTTCVITLPNIKSVDVREL